MSRTAKFRDVRAVLLGFVVLLSSACHPVEAGIDPEALGYGPGAQGNLAAGYVVDPVPRPAPTPWTPPERGSARPDLSTAAPLLLPTPYAPDVVAVCARLAGFAGARVDASDPEACLRRYRSARVFRTIGDWKTLVACIDTSDDEDAIDACEAATPSVFVPRPAYPRESVACIHLFALLIIEEMGVEPMLDRAQLLEFEPLVGECVDSLVEDSRKGRSPADYAEMLTCVERSATSDEAEACEALP